VRVLAPPSPAELAARSAHRAAAATAKINLQPEEYAARYREQFSDRLWLHALGYAGLLYVLVLAVYFSWTSWLGYQTRGVEAQVAAISGEYTNTIQLKAKLSVLQQRSQLKYAALDSWQLVAQELPAAVTLQRSSFVDGRKVVLSGQVDAADTQKLIDFYDALRKVKLHGQPFFNASSDAGDQLSYRQTGTTVTWNFSLALVQSEEAP
jgi:hypothetical protein